MGALTDARKRCFADLCLPFQPPSPSLKKLRTSPLPAKPPPLPLPAPRFPPAAPLRRAVQGPQRSITVFGLGKLTDAARVDWGGRRNQERERIAHWHADALTSTQKMGNLMLRADGRSRAKGEPSGVKDVDHSCMKLDDYKRLVDGLEVEGSTPREPCDGESGDVVDVLRTPSSVPSKIDEEEDEKHAGDAEGLDRKVDEPLGIMKFELTPVREEVGRATRSPVYKDLLDETARKYDSRLSSLEFEVKLAEKKISAIRIISGKTPKEDKDGPFAPLSEDDENDVDVALQDPDRRSQLGEVVVMHEESNIEITREIIQCLRHGAWLNDEVINLYFELLKEREKKNPKKFLKCHFFNTFFYKKLAGGREGYDFKSVRRWTTHRKIGYDLIECDKIFVPIHKEIHWCLAVISVKDEKFQYLDSLGKTDKEVLRVLARYFVDEVKDKSDRVIDVKSWKQEFVDNVPLQKNGWDCGVFMIKYADFFSRGLSLSFGQHMSYFRKRTANEILRLKAD